MSNKNGSVHSTYRFSIGDIQAIAINDCPPLHSYSAARFFSDAPPEELKKALQARDLEPDRLMSPFNCLYIDTGANHILIDTGVGTMGRAKEPGSGVLVDTMKAEGINPRRIDTVIITHAHPDHIGGIIGETGEPAFPMATFLLAEKEWAFWSDAETRRAHEEHHGIFFLFFDKNLVPVEDRIKPVSADWEIVPGVQLLELYGHTPGHVGVSIRSKGECLLYLSDTFLHLLHIEQ